ncbi:MAG TPA: hypothetical protein VMX38_21465 [Verrucomicrobiae bacterium]|jgi:hypothetical protein|nr:hypothetical protein [Verrucomicrobiae bacterium]
MNFKYPTLLILASILIACSVPIFAADKSSSKSSFASLPLDQIIDNLVRRNQERAQALHFAESTRIYHLAYRGFPGDRDGEMTVRALYYNPPSTKDFDVISQSGSKIILDRVFSRLLEGEKEADSMRDRILVNRSNYNFEFVRFDPSPDGGQYVLKLTPKSKNRFLYRGQIWVDAHDFAITRIEGEPAQNPSFWIRKSEVCHEYTKVQGFWVPAHNESVSYIRLGGRATLTIDYKDYTLNQSAPTTSTTRASVSN